MSVGAFEHQRAATGKKHRFNFTLKSQRGAVGMTRALEIGDVRRLLLQADAPGLGASPLVELLGIKPKIVDSTDVGGSSICLHVNQRPRWRCCGSARLR